MARLRLPTGLLVAGLLAGGAAGVAAIPAGASPSASGLSGQISAQSGQEQQLEGQIHGQTQVIDGYRGQIDDLRRRQRGIESSLAQERTALSRIQGQLRTERARLVVLRHRLVRARQVLADQVVALYEAPTPDIVTVVAESDGFAGLLERVGGMHAIARQNAVATRRVSAARHAVGKQVRRLAAVEAHHQRIANGMIVQRDQVAHLKLAVVNRQLEVSRSRQRNQGQLATLRTRRHALEAKLHRAQARAAQAAGASIGSGSLPSDLGGPGGGFFPSAGTNYTMGAEPQIASRLGRMGKALGLHLIGISGYRSPEHSVEVGGFPNDPHTQGQASDTPGVEGVSESTLNSFGLTRPFGGAAEADHIQLSG